MSIPGGVTKARNIAIAAKANGWANHISYKKVGKETCLTLWRNGPDFDNSDEALLLLWNDDRLAQLPEYNLFDRVKTLASQSAVLAVVNGTPDIITILKKCKVPSRVETVNRYRILPFDPINDDDDTIKSAIVGKRIWWYNRIDGKIYDGRVTVPRKKSNNFNIKVIGHRRMVNIVEAETGMRSIMLDSVLKVA